MVFTIQQNICMISNYWTDNPHKCADRRLVILLESEFYTINLHLWGPTSLQSAKIHVKAFMPTTEMQESTGLILVRT